MTDFQSLFFGAAMFVLGFIACALLVKLRRERRKGYMKPIPKAARRYMV